MKKLIFSLIASLAISQSAFAATSALTESLLEFEAITTFIGTDNDFPQTQFIVEIKRLTKQIDNLGTIKYGIIAKSFDSANPDDSHRYHTHKYIATLDVSANPGIGPNIIEVVSVVPFHGD
jgi:hypothetical protein